LTGWQFHGSEWQGENGAIRLLPIEPDVLMGVLMNVFDSSMETASISSLLCGKPSVSSHQANLLRRYRWRIPKALTMRELPESPLLQIAGIFVIGDPGWADRHDEYLAEGYIENHADAE